MREKKKIRNRYNYYIYYIYKLIIDIKYIIYNYIINYNSNKYLLWLDLVGRYFIVSLWLLIKARLMQAERFILYSHTGKILPPRMLSLEHFGC